MSPRCRLPLALDNTAAMRCFIATVRIMIFGSRRYVSCAVSESAQPRATLRIPTVRAAVIARRAMLVKAIQSVAASWLGSDVMISSATSSLAPGASRIST